MKTKDLINTILLENGILDEYNVKVDQEGDNIIIHLIKDNLEEYINSLDEDIFVEACRNIYDFTGRTLKQWSEDYNQEEVLKAFKYTVEQTENLQNLIEEKIKEIRKLFQVNLKNEEL